MAVTKTQQIQAAQTPDRDRTPAQRRIVAETRSTAIKNVAHKTTTAERSGKSK